VKSKLRLIPALVGKQAAGGHFYRTHVFKKALQSFRLQSFNVSKSDPAGV